MTLKARGARRIVVDDVAYRWTVAPNDEPGVAIVVEEAVAPARRMVAWVEHGCIISPVLVRRAIAHALASGWEPRKPGPEIVFRFLGVPPGEIVSWPPVA